MRPTSSVAVGRPTRAIAAAFCVFTALLVLPAVAQEPDFETTEIADGVYKYRYQFHNSLFVVGPEGVIAFDPISSEAAVHYTAEIQRLAPGKPLLGLVYSHDHADHISGGPTLFRALGESPIIAHENAYAKIVAANDSMRPLPDITVTEKAVLRLGGGVIELHYLGRSHSDNMLVAYLPANRIAFAVDFVSDDAVGYRNLPDWHYPELYEAIQRLQQIPFETIVFGHGPVGDRSSIDRQLEYYQELRDAVQTELDSGASREQAVERVRLPQYGEWRGYDDWFPMNVETMYDWLVSSTE
jgi:glyoxylase-like metal-dependent hydrolase (beta-lactamase superfamily II)